MASIVYRHSLPHWPHRTDRNCCRQRYHTDLKLIYRPVCCLSCHTRRVDNRRSLQIRPEQPTPSVFTKLPRPLAKDRKNALANSRPI